MENRYKLKIEGRRFMTDESAMQTSTSENCFQYGLIYEKTLFRSSGVTLG